MPGVGTIDQVRLGWWSRGYDDKRRGRPATPPSAHLAQLAKELGVDIIDAYTRGYRGRKSDA